MKKLGLLMMALAIGLTANAAPPAGKPVEPANKALVDKLEKAKVLEEQGRRVRSVREIIEKGELSVEHVKKITEVADRLISFQTEYKAKGTVPGVDVNVDVTTNIKGALGAVIRTARKTKGENIDPILDQLLANYMESARLRTEAGKQMAEAVADIFAKAEYELDAILVARGKKAAGEKLSELEAELATVDATMGAALFRVAYRINQERKGGYPELQRLLECARGSGLKG